MYLLRFVSLPAFASNSATNGGVLASSAQLHRSTTDDAGAGMPKRGSAAAAQQEQQQPAGQNGAGVHSQQQQHNGSHHQAPSQPQGQQQPHLLALHRSRHWDWRPSVCVAISACPGAPLAAVGYETGDLELWDLAHITCIQVGVCACMHARVNAWEEARSCAACMQACAAMDGGATLCAGWAPSRTQP